MKKSRSFKKYSENCDFNVKPKYCICKTKFALTFIILGVVLYLCLCVERKFQLKDFRFISCTYEIRFTNLKYLCCLR